MEALISLSPLANIVIALVALFSGMGLIFNWLLSPVKENQARIENVLTEIQRVLAENQKDLADNKRALEDNKTRINGIESRQMHIEKDMHAILQVVNRLVERKT